VPVWVARRILGTAIVGRSTHLRSEIDSVLTTSEPIDYIAVGPVYETPTKPGRPAAGLELVRYAASKVSLPWFAIGGINEANLDEVMDAGARRVVVVRAITEAADPVAAAGALRERLEQRALD
jgi:thiamine-phosphate pyrophosphorylase